MALGERRYFACPTAREHLRLTQDIFSSKNAPRNEIAGEIRPDTATADCPCLPLLRRTWGRPSHLSQSRAGRPGAERPSSPERVLEKAK
ncbi:Protein of unknown function [Gryllus bimaculatus]|nr:Protein of unknown function [Gryllus bimaculatus]